MSLADRVRTELAEALKARKMVRAGALRMLLSSMHNAEIEKKGSLTDEDVLAQVRKAIRIRKEAIEGCVKSGRKDLQAKEEEELKLLESYLPAGMSDEELGTLVAEVMVEVGAKTPADMGKVMKAVVPKVAGRADNAKVSALVRQRLSAGG